MTSLKQFGRALANSASRAAESLGLGRIIPKQQTWKVTGHAGKRGGVYRRIVGYKKTGPFYYQVGWMKNGKPKMRAEYVHTFLHATKGYRVKRTSRPTVSLANIVERRVYGPRATGFQTQHGWRNAAPSQGYLIVPCIKNAHKQPRLDDPRHAALAA